MKKTIIIIFIITNSIAGDVYKYEEAFIIDNININKLKECPYMKTKYNSFSSTIENNKQKTKTKNFSICKTKQNKIKIVIKKTIEYR